MVVCNFIGVLRDSLTPGVLLGKLPFCVMHLLTADCRLQLHAASHSPVLICHVCCSHGFIDNLQLGGPIPIGARKAPLSEKYLSMMQEVALNEQVSCFATC